MDHIIAAGVLGLLGSAHCAGMCGGFYVLGGAGQWSRRLQYLTGKTVTYTILGVAAGAVGAGAGMLMPLRNFFSIAVGIVLVVGGFVWAGWIPRFIRSNSVSARLAGVVSSALKRSGPLAPLSLGMVNGLLPCGLLYGALGIAAVAGSPIYGAGAMAVFGMATIPGLALFGELTTRLGQKFTRRAHIAGGLAMIVFGVITLLRAWSMGSHSMH